MISFSKSLFIQIQQFTAIFDDDISKLYGRGELTTPLDDLVTKLVTDYRLMLRCLELFNDTGGEAWLDEATMLSHRVKESLQLLN